MLKKSGVRRIAQLQIISVLLRLEIHSTSMKPPISADEVTIKSGANKKNPLGSEEIRMQNNITLRYRRLPGGKQISPGHLHSDRFEFLATINKISRYPDGYLLIWQRMRDSI